MKLLLLNMHQVLEMYLFRSPGPHLVLYWQFFYITYDNDHIGDGRMKITNEEFNDFCIKYYYNFRRFYESGLVNPRPNSKASPYKPHSSVDNLNRTIKSNPTTAEFDMVTKCCKTLRRLSQLLLRSSFSGLTRPLLAIRMRGARRGLKCLGFIQVVNLIPFVIRKRRQFLVMKEGVRFLCLITLRIFSQLLLRTGFVCPSYYDQQGSG